MSSHLGEGGALSALWKMSCGIFIDIGICLPPLFHKIIMLTPPPKRKILYETLYVVCYESLFYIIMQIHMKCHRYWPKVKTESMKHGNFLLTLKDIQTFPYCEVRTLDLIDEVEHILFALLSILRMYVRTYIRTYV